jgi:hypothetical protein
MLIPLLLISMCIVLAIYVGVSTICLVLHSYMIKYQYVHIMLMVYSWINLIGKLLRFLTACTDMVSVLRGSESKCKDCIRLDWRCHKLTGEIVHICVVLSEYQMYHVQDCSPCSSICNLWSCCRRRDLQFA